MEGEVTMVTGAGRGIGYEAASALLWLGERVVIAEIDEKTGDEASKQLRGFEREPKKLEEGLGSIQS